MRYSVITCVSDPKIYEECLLRSIYSIKHNHVEIVPIINVKNIYSAAVANNIGLQVSRSDWVIFAHQDVALKDDWFNNLDKLISENNGAAIISAAGIRKNHDGIGRWGGSLSIDSAAVGKVWNDNVLEPDWNGSKITQPIYAGDECLIVMDRKLKLQFDQRFTGFHFYGIDLCLQAQAAGYQVLGANMPIIHYGKHSSSMSEGNKYWIYFKLLHDKWKRLFPEVYTTHMHWVGDNLTSYIPTQLESDGLKLTVKASSITKIRINDI